MVRWQGCSPIHDSWEPLHTLDKCAELIAEFRKTRMDDVSADQHTVRNEVKDMSKELSELKQKVSDEIGSLKTQLRPNIKTEEANDNHPSNVPGLSGASVKLEISSRIKNEPTLSQVYVCPHCNKQLTRNTILKNHIAKFHANTPYAPKPKVQCSVCGLK